MASFVDVVTIRCKAGDGGDGCVSVHREKFVQQGGPDGGDGGKGGDVIFVGSERMHTLLDFRYKRSFAATSGAQGQSGRRKGRDGEDCVIEAPVGTVVKDKATGRVLIDLHQAGERRVLLRGGNGGFGNARFATPTRQAPNFAKPGVKNQPVELELELKSIADVGLVGFPNAGKSTLLSMCTAAKPKIANYPFTTLQPNLGIARQDGDSFIIADIPGIVEGASEGVGLGYEFLRHIERTRLLVHMVDIAGCDGRDPVEDYRVIRSELAHYGDLADRPCIVAANKCDLPEAAENLQRLRDALPGQTVYALSAATNQGVEELMREVAARLRELPPAEPFLEETPFEEAALEPFRVTRADDGAYEVSGPGIDRLIGSVNFADEDSLNWFHRTLRRWGVIDALREKGAGEGDTVRIQDMEFDFVE